MLLENFNFIKYLGLLILFFIRDVILDNTVYFLGLFDSDC